MTIAADYFRRYALAFFVAFAFHLTLFIVLQVVVETLVPAAPKFVIEPKPLKAQLIRFRPQVVAPIDRTGSTAPASAVKNEKKTAITEELNAESEREQRERLQREREVRLQELRDRAFRDALGEELTSEMVNASQDLSQTYITGIYLAVVENWSRPASARNDMSVIVLVELFPSGDLNSVGVIESSDHMAFDRSALNAVKRAAPFAVPDDAALFEANFRSFTLNFRPEDLLR